MRTTSWFKGAGTAGAWLALAGCGGGGSGPAPTADAGDAAVAVDPADLKAFSYLTNSIPVAIEVDGFTGLVIVDTGNPWVLLDPTTFGDAANLPTTGGTVPSITLADQTSSLPWTYGTTSGDLQVDPTFSINGNVGCTVLCNFVAAFDYRDVTFALDPTSKPSNLGASTTLDFTLEGGDGNSMYPASRVVVTVSLEGADYAMILDTGASDVTVSAAAYKALTADGRTQITGGIDTTAGTSSSSLTRAASVAVGGVAATGVVVSHDVVFDSNLASVSEDVGRTIDGSLGGTYLRNFYVTLDYAKHKLTLARYDDVGFFLDQGELLGITLGIEVDGVTYSVTAVTPDAARKGVAVGDVVTALGGTPLASISSVQVAALLYGPVGTTRSVTFGKAATLSGKTVPLVIEETLPL